MATGSAGLGVALPGRAGWRAIAVGAIAIGALAIGRLSVTRGHIRRLRIEELSVGRLVRDDDASLA